MAALVAGSTLLAFAAVPQASADGLRDRKHRVQGNISQTLDDLDQSSAKLEAATQALQAAQTRLDTAQQHLAQTRGELAAAVALDKRMQVALDQAVLRLNTARTDLTKGKADVAAQERVLGQIAVQNYQQGDPSLLGLSMVLTSQDPAQLTGQLNSVHSVLDKESVTLDRLDASRVLLTVKEQEFEKAKQEVADKRRQAAENLAHKQTLESQAEQAEQAVSNLVTLRSRAHDAAAKAKAADLEMLRGLQQERDKISNLLAQRAAAAQARAEADAAQSAADSAEGAAGVSHGVGGFLSYPVIGPITSPYGMRMHPVYHRWTLHDGTDFGVPCGTPVHAAASGRIIATYYNTGYGNRIIMDNGFHRGVGLGTAYNHLSRYASHVGEHVQRGEVIGYSGTTGYSTGCHLHFMVFENGATVDPMTWL